MDVMRAAAAAPDHRRGAGERRHIDALDAVRAIAALFVFAYHLDWYGVDFGVLSPLVAGAHKGTVVFFVLSGYLLYEPFVRGPVPLRAYLVRRALRIVPAYVVALTGVSILMGDRSFFDAPVTYLFFLQNFDARLFQGFLASAWTLQLEATFYVLLPVMAVVLGMLVRRGIRRAGWVLLSLSAASFLGGFVALVAVGGRQGALVAALFPFMFWEFALGMGLALIAVRRADMLGRLGSTRAALLGVTLVAAGFALNTFYSDILVGVGAFLVLAAALVRRPSGRLVRACAVAGATLSYPFYLWHQDVVVWLTVQGFTGPTLVAAALALTLGVSVISYLLVERPAMRLGRRARTARGAASERRPMHRALEPA